MNEVALRDAATVMLVRDGAGGLEVFMLRRTPNAAFAGGAYVFPGGSVDGADRSTELESYCAGRTDADASQVLGVDRGGLAFWVAAVRESFEEAGVLLAYDSCGELVRLDQDGVAERFRTHRADIDHGRRLLIDVCAEEELRLAVDGIHYFSHWITPPGQLRRFDTRFFVARAPAGQEALHDDAETVESRWIRPADALEAHRQGDIDLIVPTIRNLMALDRFERTAELVATAAAATDIPTMQPRVVLDGGGVRIVLPGDAEYGEALVPSAPLSEAVPLPGRPGGPSIPGLRS
ncbi:MAG: NUDIX hydrolase [Acidimicrobiales bacterium]